MPTEAVEIDVAGRTVRVTNPDKVFFPARGETKLDLARYYLAVGDGALRGVFERPTVLKRFPDGALGRTLLPEAGPGEATGVARDGAGDVPERTLRRRAVPGRRGPHRLGGQPWLPRPQPVGGAASRRRSSRRAAGRPRPPTGRAASTWCATSRGSSARCSTRTSSSATPKTSGSPRHPRQRAHRAALGLHRSTPCHVALRYAAIGDPAAAIDDVASSLEPLLELAARDERDGLGDEPWPPNFPKAKGEPSRRRAESPRSRYREHGHTRVTVTSSSHGVAVAPGKVVAVRSIRSGWLNGSELGSTAGGRAAICPPCRPAPAAESAAADRSPSGDPPSTVATSHPCSGWPDHAA